jgi:WD40 repeat protein
MQTADGRPAEPDYLTVAGRLYDLCSRLLYGPGTWFEACHAAAAGDPEKVADLVARLTPGHDVARALATRRSWPGRSRLARPAGLVTGSALSAAASAAAVVEVLGGAEQPDERLLQAAAHWRRANVLPKLPLTGAGVGGDLPDSAAAAALRRLAVLADDSAPEAAVWGMLALLVRALRDASPTAERGVEVPVLFDRRATGGHGLLQLQRMDDGPPGLYPDPRSMMFLVADGQFATALDAAWRTAPQQLTGRCVVWRLTTDGQPCDQLEGGSLGGAFGVALAELARPVPARLQPRRLDRRCAVTAGLRPDGRLVEVAGTRNKLEEAVRRRLRVVLAPPSGGDPPSETLLREASVRYATDLAAAIRLTRTQVNRTFAALTAAVLMAVSGIAGGAFYAERRASQERERSIGTRLLGNVATLRAQNPADALLLEALAFRLGGAGARRALVRDLIANRYIGKLPTPVGGARLCGGQQGWSPDGTTVATVQLQPQQQSVTLWGLQARKSLRTIQTHGSVTSCAFAPDGKTLAVAAGGSLSLVALASDSGDPSVAIVGGVEDVQYARDGLLATESYEGPVRLWSVTTARRPHLLSAVSVATDRRGGSSPQPRLTFSPDSRTLAVKDHGVTALVDVRSPEAPHQVALLPGLAWCTAFSPDGATLATGMSDGITVLWDVRSPDRPHRRSNTAPPKKFGLVVGSAAFTPDGRLLITDGAVLGEVWQIDGDAPPQYLRQATGGPHQVTGVALAPDGNTIIAEDGDGFITLWRTHDSSVPPVLATLPLSRAGVSGVAFPRTTSPQLTVTTADGSATLWNVSDPSHPTKTQTAGSTKNPSATGAIYGSDGARFSPDGRSFALLDNGAVAVWEITAEDRFRRTGTIPAPAGKKIAPLALSSDGILLTTERTDDPDDEPAPPSVWQIGGTPRMLGQLPDLAVTGTFAPDGHTLVTRVDGGETTWWDVTAPTRPVRLALHRAKVEGLTGPVAFTPDGRLLAATESGAPGILVDTTDRTAPVVLGSNPGPAGTPGDAVFDGDMLVMASLGVVSVWDVTEPADATRLTEFDTGKTGAITGRMAVSPSGVLATAELGDLPNAYYTGEGTVQLWDLTPIREILADPVALACRIAGGDLSPDLWQRYAPDLRLRPICR